jgi:phage baseplate assembly protein W
MQVRYILEAKYGQKSKKIFLPYVGHIDFARQHAVHTTWTFGRVPYHQYSGIRQQQIKLSGRSGLRPNFEAPSLFDFAAVSDDMSGPALFRQLEKFFEEFETKAFNAQQIYEEEPKLIFKALWEEKSFYVTHTNFSWSRDKSNSRFSYEWSLELDTYADLEKPEPNALTSILNTALAAAKAATIAINAASVAINSATRVLQSIEQNLDKFKEPLRAFVNMSQEIKKLGTSADSVIRFPQSFFNEVFIALGHAVSLVFEAWARLPFFDKDAARATMFRVLTSLAEARRVVVTALGLNFIGSDLWTTSYEKKGQTPLTQKSSALKTSPISAGFVLVNGQTAQVYEVKSGENLLDIAQEILGNRDAWKSIASLNNMSSPTTLATGAPLVAGSIVYVPVASDSPANLIGSKDVYSTDILIKNGDMVIAGIPGQNATDVRTVSGISNLKQALSHRLLTERGDNSSFPDYGVPKLVGTPSAAYKIAEAAAEVRAQFGAEKRIESVKNLSVIDNGDRMVVNATVTPVNGQAFSINVPVLSV